MPKKEAKTQSKVGIAGASGRVGQLLVSLLETDGASYPNLELAGQISGSDDANALFQQSDIVIDFTRPAGTVKFAELAARTKTALVVGTTGLSAEDEAALHDAARSIPIIYAANFSLGVNVLLSLVKRAAASLPAPFDIEIVETHHKHKVDAPSGTALAIGKAAAAGRNIDFHANATLSREGETGERKTGTIGFGTLRGGDVVGEHTAYFYGMGERVELSHRATDRAIFARGALYAAQWLHETAPPPALYSMEDVLKLSD